MTNLSRLRPGTEVNLEADIIAKYVERLLSVAPNIKDGETPRLTMERLADLGYK